MSTVLGFAGVLRCSWCFSPVARPSARCSSSRVAHGRGGVANVGLIDVGGIEADSAAADAGLGVCRGSLAPRPGPSVKELATGGGAAGTQNREQTGPHREPGERRRLRWRSACIATSHRSDGRTFDSGKAEAIVGRALAEQFDVRLGSKVRLGRGGQLEVVSFFSSRGGTAEMEIWLDKKVYEQLVIRPATACPAPPRSFDPNSTLWVQLEGGASGLRQLSEAIARELDGADEGSKIQCGDRSASSSLPKSKDLVERAGGGGGAVGLVMGLGALFGAINTMYAAVAHRSREIATLGLQAFSLSPSQSP